MSGQFSGDFSGDGRTFEFDLTGYDHLPKLSDSGVDPAVQQHEVQLRKEIWWYTGPENYRGTQWFNILVAEVSLLYGKATIYQDTVKKVSTFQS